jgi:hypothetical protein
MRVQARARRRAAQRDLRDARERCLHPLAAEADLRRIATELLAERDRHRVHQVRAAGFDHVGELAGLGFQRRLQLRQRGQQRVGGL